MPMWWRALSFARLASERAPLRAPLALPKKMTPEEDFFFLVFFAFSPSPASLSSSSLPSLPLPLLVSHPSAEAATGSRIDRFFFFLLAEAPEGLRFSIRCLAFVSKRRAVEDAGGTEAAPAAVAEAEAVAVAAVGSELSSALPLLRDDDEAADAAELLIESEKSLAAPLSLPIVSASDAESPSSPPMVMCALALAMPAGRPPFPERLPSSAAAAGGEVSPSWPSRPTKDATRCRCLRSDPFCSRRTVPFFSVVVLPYLSDSDAFFAFFGLVLPVARASSGLNTKGVGTKIRPCAAACRRRASSRFSWCFRCRRRSFRALAVARESSNRFEGVRRIDGGAVGASAADSAALISVCGWGCPSDWGETDGERSVMFAFAVGCATVAAADGPKPPWILSKSSADGSADSIGCGTTVIALALAMTAVALPAVDFVRCWRLSAVIRAFRSAALATPPAAKGFKIDALKCPALRRVAAGPTPPPHAAFPSSEWANEDCDRVAVPPPAPTSAAARLLLCWGGGVASSPEKDALSMGAAMIPWVPCWGAGEGCGNGPPLETPPPPPLRCSSIRCRWRRRSALCC